MRGRGKHGHSNPFPEWVSGIPLDLAIAIEAFEKAGDEGLTFQEFVLNHPISPDDAVWVLLWLKSEGYIDSGRRENLQPAYWLDPIFVGTLPSAARPGEGYWFVNWDTGLLGWRAIPEGERTLAQQSNDELDLHGRRMRGVADTALRKIHRIVRSGRWDGEEEAQERALDGITKELLGALDEIGRLGDPERRDGREGLEARKENE